MARGGPIQGGFLMKVLFRWGVVTGLLLALSAPVHAQVSKGGTAATKFLTLDSSARVAGVASSATSYTDLGAFSALTNQATMVFVEGRGAVGVSYAPYFAEMTVFSAGLVWNLGDNGAVGVSVHSLLSGDIPYTTSGDPTGQFANQGQNFNVTDLAIGPSYARRLTDSFAVGGSLKYVSEGTSGAGDDDRTSTAVAVDVGTIYTTDFRNFRIGASFQNFGPDMQFIDESSARDQLPTTFRIGFAIEPTELPVGSIMTSAELWKLREFDSVLNLGIEWWVNDYIAGRVGWKAGYSGGQDEGVSAGAGLRFSQGELSLNVDYAYTQYELLDDLHRVSVGVGF
ncbi:MAG: PorV/PorQ family protein [Gemmatimonadetes bacterium]|nr:PorV/PorQ family protein [Gemmatimonadota bacterium]